MCLLQCLQVQDQDSWSQHCNSWDCSQPLLSKLSAPSMWKVKLKCFSRITVFGKVFSVFFSRLSIFIKFTINRGKKRLQKTEHCKNICQIQSSTKVYNAETRMSRNIVCPKAPAFNRTPFLSPGHTVQQQERVLLTSWRV